jgi:DNA-binding SARP family transcriptional activator/DNA-binding XRE family transcriptional regulator
MSTMHGQRSTRQVGILIRERRIAGGLTQRQLADAAGISLGAICDLEQGRTKSPTRRVAEELGAILGIDQRELDDTSWTETGLVRLSVLGSLRAWIDGAEIALGSVRQRAVLGLLALHRQDSLHRDALIDVLWGERPPASAVTELQGYVSRLRKLLGAGRDGKAARGPITTVGASYRLAARDDQLDVAVFEQLAKRAQRAFSNGNADRACGLYERALSLWRGGVLADIDLLRRHPAATALAYMRSDVVLQYAAAAELTDSPGRALPPLRELCGRESFNEEAHAHMMIILAATGQQAAALVVFAELRSRLDEDLGISPGALLGKAHIQVLRQQAISGSAVRNV